MLALRLTKDLEHRLAALAKATGRTKSYYAREAITLLLGELEGTYLHGLSRTVRKHKVGRVTVLEELVPNLDALVAARKRASRDADQVALATGKLTRAQLRRKNSAALGHAFDMDMKRVARIKL